MKENTDTREKSWIRNFHELGLGYKLKATEAILTLLSTSVDLSTLIPLSLAMIKDNDIEKEEAVVSLLSSIRRSCHEFKDKVKGAVFEMAKDTMEPADQTVVSQLLSSNREQVIKERFGYETKKDLKMRIEELLMASMPHSFKRNHVPDGQTVDFKVLSV